MNGVWQDIKFGCRMMLRSPGFTCIAILTLALGIGANTAIFSIVKGVVLRPLPFDQPGQLYNLWTDLPGFGRESASLPDYKDWRDQGTVFEQLAAYRYGAGNLAGGSEPERVSNIATTPNLFSVLRLKPFAGRLLADSDDLPQAAPVAVLSYSFWQRKFGGALEAIGKPVTLNTTAYTIVGILPPEFESFSDVDLVTPTLFTPQQLARLGRRSDFLHVVGRAKPGVTQVQITSQMRDIGARLAQQYPQTNKGVGIQASSVQRDLLGNMRPLLLSLWASVGFMLLIVCVNMANLMLAKGAVRQREMAIRAALGARSRRLVRQLLTEGLTLAVIGATLGILFANWGTAAVLAVAPKDIPFVSRIQLDSTVLAFGAGLALITGLLFSLIPSLHGSKIDLNTGLKESSRTASTVRHSLRQVLVVSEIALSLVLLAGAGLMIRTLHQLYKAQPGFDPDRLLTFRVSLPPGRYNDGQQTAFFNQLLVNLRSLPGVKSAGATNTPYIDDGGNYLTFNLQGAPPMQPGEGIDAQVRSVTPAYMETMGVRLLRGRNLTDADRADGHKVTVINQKLIDRYFAGQELLGRSLTLNGNDWYEIVGIISDVKQRGVDAEVYPEIDLPQAQSPYPAMTVVLRTQVDPLSLVPTARATVAALDPTLPVYSVQTMDGVLAETRAPRRFQAGLLASFAGLALLLAAIGIYGVMAHSVAHRTPEFGIRMALGAPPREVLRLVLSNGMRLSVIGLCLGILGALGVSRFLQTFLFEVRSYDPFTLVTVSLLLGSVAMFASFIPARRAMKIDPMHALRNE